MTGAVTDRKQAIEDEIVRRISEGEPLAAICRDLKIGRSTVYEWRELDENFDGRIARARISGFDAIAEEGLAIVDDVAEDPASRRVRADYRLKLLAKWDPKRYGELVKLSGADGSSPAMTSLAVSFVRADTADDG